ncbi:MAG: hypothetical protein A2498_15515 [Lentisphaerae bacterium RIFOXYC12_FULL_60_16]|nr:MAG: hypothetical protein A2498_15515 [Lentisphaerae bacterium RIFOXYC12_FULL_60_16]OGV75283.1 MAG: hypothetical protein A2340_12965 [Lentisphaerae bacterium RIFOXYB12_FULL_60_10]
MQTDTKQWRIEGWVVVGVCLAGFLVISSSIAIAQDDKGVDIPARLVALNQRLLSVQRALDDAQNQVKAAAWGSHDFERTVAYSNEQTRVLYAEVKALEKQLNLKRQEYTDAIRKDPQFREIEKARAQAYSRISQLREEEQQLRQDINRLKALVGGP